MNLKANEFEDKFRNKSKKGHDNNKIDAISNN